MVWTLSYKNSLANKSNNSTSNSTELTLNSSIQLLGHTNKTRALLFPSCLPTHLLSGGWDKTIRLWHLPSRSCVFFCSDHQSDVYGLLSHFERPAIIVSCSRDSTIRVWSLEEKIKEKIWMEMFGKGVRSEYDLGVKKDEKLFLIILENILSFIFDLHLLSFLSYFIFFRFYLLSFIFHFYFVFIKN